MRTLLFTVLLVGLAAPAPAAPKKPEVRRAQAVPAPGLAGAAPPPQASTAPADGFGSGATLRPGDMFEMKLSGVPLDESAGFQIAFTVGGDGLVNIPYAGFIRAVGLTQNQLEQAIQKKLIDEKIFRFPTVTVVMSGGQVRYVTIGGQVRNPNRFVWSNDLTLLSAISAAGGVGDFGGDKVSLTRSGEKKVYSLKRLKKNPADDPRLLPGDLIEAL